MLKLLVAPFILYTLFGATHSYGQDQRPSMGLLFHPEENSSIQYSCQASGKEMICDFTQTFVRPQVAPEQMATKSKELYESIINENISLKDCDEFSAISTKLAEALKDPSKIPLEHRNELAKWPEYKRTEVLETSKAMERLCRNKTRENINDVHSLLLKAEKQTCRVGSNSWRETFHKASSTRTPTEGSNVWVSKSTPEGVCGVVQLNRFEIDSSVKNKAKLWNYIARKAVTNPKATMLLGGQCSELDETTHLYSWRSREIYLDCKTIKFSPL